MITKWTLKFLRLNQVTFAICSGVILIACSRGESVYDRFPDKRPVSCQVTTLFMPKEDLIKFHTTGNFKPEEMIITGACTAKELDANIWYTKGIFITPAMSKRGVSARHFESFLYLATDPSLPSVRSFGPQYVPCSFKIDGVATRSQLASKKDCHGADNFVEFQSKLGI